MFVPNKRAVYISGFNGHAKQKDLYFEGKPVSSMQSLPDGNIKISFDANSAYIEPVNEQNKEEAGFVIINKGNKNRLKGLSVDSWERELNSGSSTGKAGRRNRGMGFQYNGVYYPVIENIERKGASGKRNEAFVDENDDLMAR